MSNVNSANFNRLLLEGLKVIYGAEYPEYPEEYSKYYNVDTSSKAYEESLSMSGLPMLIDKAEGSSVSYQDFLQGYVNKVKNTTKALGVIISRELLDDDQYGKIMLVPKMMRRSIYYRVETDAANILNNAHSSSFTYADGKALCVTDHPLLHGGTFKNTLTTPADLSETSFEQILIDISDFVDDRGMIFNATAKMLIVPQDGMYSASQILGSDKVPESNLNASNPAEGIMPYMVSRFMTDPDQYVVITDVPNGLTFYWREKPELTYDNDFDSRDKKIKTVCRYSVTCHDPRGVFSVPGA